MNAVAKRRLIEVTKVAHLQGHKGAIYDFVVDKEAETVYTAGADGVVAAWQASNPNGKSILQAGEPLYSINLSNNVLRVGSQNGTIYTINLDNKSLISSDKKHSGGVFFINGSLSGGEDGFLVNDKNRFSLSKESLRCLVETPTEWIIGSSDFTIYRVLKMDSSVVAQLKGHTNSVFSVELLDKNTLVSTGRDALIKVWDLTINMEIHSVSAHLYQAKSLAFSGDLLLSCSMDKTIKVWNDKLDLLKVIDFERNKSHTNCINKVKWLDENRFISCSDDRSLIFWQVENK